MAGNYPDAPGHRMAYDRDGSVCVGVNPSGTPFDLTASLPALNDEDADPVYTTGNTYVTTAAGIWLFGLIFPELRDLDGWYGNGSNYSNTVGAFEWSADTTNLVDGTWTSIANPFTVRDEGVSPNYRTQITALALTGVKGLRWTWNNDGFDAHGQYWRVLHLYGSIAAGEHPDRLRIWHPTDDQEIDPAYFDWGNAARGTTADKPFRRKNNSGTKTASDIAVGIEALTDTTPAVAGQHAFSLDGSTFTATVSPPDLAPEAISDTITLRRTTPADAVLSVWAARIKAEATFPASAPLSTVGVMLPGIATSYASTPDSVANSITSGDMDIRIRCSCLWTGSQMLVSKYFNSGGRQYQLFVFNGSLYFDQSNLGSNTWEVSGGAAGLVDDEVAWARVTYRASDRRVQFWKTTAETETGWTQVGTDQTGVTSPMFDSSIDLRIGTNGDAQYPLDGTVYEVKIYASLDETDLRVHFNPASVEVAGTRDPTSFVGATGETWTLNGTDWDWVTA